MRAHRVCGLLLVLLLPRVARGDPQPPVQPPAIPPTTGKANIAADTSEDRSPFAPGGLSEFTPSRLNALGVALSFSKDKPEASLNMRPFRLFSERRALWGFEAMLITNSDSNKSSLRVGYTFVPRWHLDPNWTEDAERVTGKCNAACIPARKAAKVRIQKDRRSCNKDDAPPPLSKTATVVLRWVRGVATNAVKRVSCEAKRTDAQLESKISNDESVQAACACLKTLKKRELRAADEHWMNLALPTASLTYSLGMFHADTSVPDQRILASHSLGIQVAWRFAVYGEAQFAYTYESARADSKNSSELASTTGFSASLQATIPEVFGSSYYDDEYLEKKTQAGLVLGVVYTLKQCLEQGDARLSCPKLEVDSTYVGTIIGLKVNKDLQPQIQIGHRSTHRASTDGTGEEQTIAGIEAIVQLVFTLK